VKGLIYPLVAIAALMILTFLIAAVTTAISHARRSRAIAYARWEPFTVINRDGKAAIGVRLTARWGRHVKVLRADGEPEQVDPEDFLARIEAYTRAENRAAAYNMAIGENE
jgi:hypothetical protein